MKLCLVSREYPPETASGGIGTQTYLKAHALAAKGHNVRVISGSNNAQRRELQDGPVHVIRTPAMYDRFPVNTEAVDWLTYSVAVAVEIAESHAKDPIDLLDFPEWSAEGYVHLLNRQEWNHIPTVIQLHGPLMMFARAIGWPLLDSEYFRIGTSMEGTCLRLADAIFSSSRCSAEWCARYYDLDAGKIPVIHTGVDTALFAPGPEGEKDQRPTIIFVGRISGDKGAAVLVDAACRIAPAFPRLQLRLLGRGEESFVSNLRSRAVDAGFPDLLDFPGFVDRQALPRHLARAHVFAGPSVHEPGPGLVYLEAMSCGLPVVACNSAGATEVVLPGENGLLVPPNDACALAESLQSLLCQTDERQQMGARARQFVLQTADSKLCIDRIESFYLSVLKGHR